MSLLMAIFFFCILYVALLILEFLLYIEYQYQIYVLICYCIFCLCIVISVCLFICVLCLVYPLLSLTYLYLYVYISIVSLLCYHPITFCIYLVKIFINFWFYYKITTYKLLIMKLSCLYRKLSIVILPKRRLSAFAYSHWKIT